MRIWSKDRRETNFVSITVITPNQQQYCMLQHVATCCNMLHVSTAPRIMFWHDCVSGSGPVTQVQFINASTIASASDDGPTRFWDVGTSQEWYAEGFTFFKGTSRICNKMTMGKYVITTKGDFILVHQTDTPVFYTVMRPVAFFRAPSLVRTIECTGDNIVAVCQRGEVLHLRAAFLAT